jgi:hypothetical protein
MKVDRWGVVVQVKLPGGRKRYSRGARALAHGGPASPASTKRAEKEDGYRPAMETW